MRLAPVLLPLILATCQWQMQPPRAVPPPYVAPVHHGWQSDDPVGERVT